MSGSRSNYYLRAAMGGMIGLISLLFFPFAGFTEVTAYVPSPIYRDYGLTALGTHGQEFNLFGFPSALAIIQILMLLLAVALIYPIARCWRWHQDPGSETAAEVRKVSRVTIGIGAISVLLVLVGLVVVFPGVEDQTIWLTESSGWIADWWPAYGAFVTPVAVGAMAVALALRVNKTPVTPVTPVTPAPPPTEPPPS